MTFLPVLLALSFVADRAVTPPPAALVERFALDPFYEKCVDADGFPIVGSAYASDVALLEAAHLIDRMLSHQPALRAALIDSRTRFVVMARTEMTTDVPEHAHLRPTDYWDRRARGLGATPEAPAVSCGEENLLCLDGDPYAAENILIHEFAHAIHHTGLTRTDPTFDGRLYATFLKARGAKLWEGKYAATNRAEYWAEGVQSWFDTNRVNDHDHNHVDTRDELKEYDPGLAALCAEVFGEGDWRYAKPATRAVASHFEGYDAASATPFAWPADLPPLSKENREQHEKAKRRDDG